MAVPSPAPGSPSKFDRLKMFVKRYPIPTAIVLVACLVLTPSIVYYELSFNSVNGTHPEIITGYMSASYFSATFYVTVHVWSWAGSLIHTSHESGFHFECE
ncbi:MAG TPA: hypothetical protein VNA15_11270 [Candidatus Angelobacter sp.]|nr:hypothetical protein [Candidatus Angelobacter sp.]